MAEFPLCAPDDPRVPVVLNILRKAQFMGGNFTLDARRILAALDSAQSCPETTVGLLGNLAGPPIRHRCRLTPHDDDYHQCGCGLTWHPVTDCHAEINEQQNRICRALGGEE